MNTVTLHAHVQRTRFAQHALSAVTGFAQSLFSLPLRSTVPARVALTPAESASLEAQKVRNLAQSYSKTCLLYTSPSPRDS